MKRIELEKQMLYHIISEPGDSTLYDYINVYTVLEVFRTIQELEGKTE